jgi:PAS domain S-box-containing protein
MSNIEGMSLRELTDTLNMRDQELIESEKMFKAIFCINPIPMVICTSPEGIATNCNRAFCEFSKWSEEEIIGNSLLQIGIYETPYEREQMLAKADDKGHIRNVKVHFKDKEGHVFPALVSAKPIEIKNKLHLIAVAIVDRRMSVRE